MSTEEVLVNLEAVLKEAGNTASLPALPRTGDSDALVYWGELAAGTR